MICENCKPILKEYAKRLNKAQTFREVMQIAKEMEA